ncbi:MAG: hypothetical protein JRI23_35175 [Deltaproteobacteria bacterium]|jgi:hypothetical protein|nr:hypothetical protein [Deltaproteobacteria bacterium]MBW2537556.1 hypothetical protein [Deltaproteobacteria bacterium]
MISRPVLLGLAALLVACGSAQAPVETAPSPADDSTVGSDEGSTDPQPVEPAEQAAKPEPACRPSATEDVPPTTEAPCGPEICLESKPGLLATCIDSKHKGCTHYLLVRVTEGGSTEPLNVYVRCPKDKSIQGTLMKSYAPTGVPSLPAESKPPEKACTHIAVHDCPAEEGE